MPPLSHARASWPEYAPRPRRTARDYTDVVVLSVMVFVVFAYACLEKALHSSRPPVVPSERPSHARRLSFAVTSSVGWNTPASEGEIVTTKGLKGFETSYAVYFGDAREKRESMSRYAAALASAYGARNGRNGPQRRGAAVAGAPAAPGLGVGRRQRGELLFPQLVGRLRHR